MTQNEKYTPANGMIILFFVLVNVIAIKDGYIGDEEWHIVLFLTIPLLILSVTSIRPRQKNQTTGHSDENQRPQSVEIDQLPKQQV